MRQPPQVGGPGRRGRSGETGVRNDHGDVFTSVATGDLLRMLARPAQHATMQHKIAR